MALVRPTEAPEREGEAWVHGQPGGLAGGLHDRDVRKAGLDHGHDLGRTRFARIVDQRTRRFKADDIFLIGLTAGSAPRSSR
jgi:hypothetical protein